MVDEVMSVSDMVDSAAESLNTEEKEVADVEVNEPVEENEATAEIDQESEDESIEELVDEEEAEESDDEEPVATREAPKSWAKEQHEVWAKLPPEAQDYIEHREKQMLEGIEEYKEYAQYGRALNNVISPYQAMFDQAGIDIGTGVQYLLNAQYKLQTGTPEQRKMELTRIAQQYGVKLGESGENTDEALDPRLVEMQNTINQLQEMVKGNQEQTLTATRQRTAQEVDAFANDGSHPYFDEVADEIALQIKLGKSLQDAYDVAVYANPVTRAKEIARIQTENAAKLKEKRQQEVAKAKKATASNVRTIDTTRTPTEKVGKLFSSDYDAEMLAKAQKLMQN